MIPTLQQVRDAINCSGRTRSEICKRVGLDKAHMSRFMAGNQGLAVATVDAIAAELGMEVVLRRRRSEKSEKLNPV